MTSHQFVRSQMLIGSDALHRLAGARVAVFGVGGVGGYCVEALARGGIGTLHLYDDDVVAESNLNRQLAALHSTLGQSKVEVMAQRVQDINPHCQAVPISMFYLPENAHKIDLTQYDYVVDAVDTVTAKVELATRCVAHQVPLISSMGSANKVDPSALRVGDLSQTRVCPLARIMRRELRRRGIEHLQVVYSTEPPCIPQPVASSEETPCPTSTRPSTKARRSTPGSLPFVPAVAGLLLASVVLRELGSF